MRRRSSVLRVFGAPLAIALLSLAGLLTALLGDGVADAIASVGLAVPVVAVGWAVAVRRR